MGQPNIIETSYSVPPSNTPILVLTFSGFLQGHRLIHAGWRIIKRPDARENLAT